MCDCELIFEWVCVMDWFLTDVCMIFVFSCVIVDWFCVIFVWWSGFRMTFGSFFCNVELKKCKAFQQFVWFCVMEWFLNHVRIISNGFWIIFVWWNRIWLEWFLNGFVFLKNLYCKMSNNGEKKNIFNPNPNSTTIATSSPNKIIQKCWEYSF